MKFVSLHQHTEWSALDGLVNIKDLVARAKEYGMPGVAITDHGTMSGVFKFYEECKAQGINPIIGEEFYISKRKMTDKEPEDKERYHLTVLAKNMNGLKNLFKLSSLSYTEGFYFKPRIDEQTLVKYGKDLIVLSGCHSSKISQYLVGDKEKGTPPNPLLAKKFALRFKQIWGDDFYLEIQTHGLKGCPRPWDEQVKLNKEIIKLSKQIGVKVVLTADSHYLDLEDTDAHEILLCIGTNNYFNDKDRWTLRDFDLSFPKPENVEKWLLDEYGTTEYAENTIEINNKVNIEWEYGAYLIPKFDTGEDSEYDYMRKLVYSGFLKKCPEKLKDKVYTDRVKFELDTLKDMGYLGYFLIVQDYVNWAKKNGIGVGPSRGSCAGSLVAYLLNIIEVNPMEVGTLFERFINPERPTMPDIDVDFEDSRRIEVVQYVTQKYGKECVCNILILNYMKSKSVFKDVARVFEIPFKESNDLSALIPQDKPAEHHKLIDALEVEDFKKIYDREESVHKVVDFALKLEGKPRNHGVHACGVIIAPSDLTDYIPVEIDKDGKVISQFPPEDLEKLGLLKMDFLGLSTISVIQNTLQYIPELNSLYDIPTDDEATFKTFQNGESYFTFQFNTPLARETCIKMHPENIRELSDVTAIARPGPMENIPVYEKRKKGLEKVNYINKWAEEFFSDTYGLNIYQEQGMLYLQKAAGFSKAQADFWRKGVAKAKMDILRDLYPKYIEGSKKNGIPQAMAEKWWNDQVDGGAYTFNLAHSYAYAWIGYITGYLLTHYPVPYMAAVMNNWADDKDKLAECFTVCKKLGIKILPPNVKKSGMNFVPDGKNIIYGLSAVKGLGKQAEIIIERTREANPNTLEDFLMSIEKKVLNKTKLQGLIYSGALDCFGVNRLSLKEGFDDILTWRDKHFTKAKKNSETLFNLEPTERIPLPEHKTLSNRQKLDLLQYEKEATGSYMSYHPLEMYKITIPQELEEDERANRYNKKKPCWVNVFGVCNTVECKVSKKKGTKYKLVEFDIGASTLTLSVFESESAIYSKFKEGEILKVDIFKDVSFSNSHGVAKVQTATPHAYD